MACCAFVAFLVSQIYVLGQGVVRLFGRRPAACANAPQLWRLDTTAVARLPAQSATVARPQVARGFALMGLRPGLALFLLLAAVELALAVSGVQWFLLGRGGQLLAADFRHLASSGAITSLRDLCGL
jgi:hypothetical protein